MNMEEVIEREEICGGRGAVTSGEGEDGTKDFV